MCLLGAHGHISSSHTTSLPSNCFRIGRMSLNPLRARRGAQYARDTCVIKPVGLKLFLTTSKSTAAILPLDAHSFWHLVYTFGAACVALDYFLLASYFNYRYAVSCENSSRGLFHPLDPSLSLPNSDIYITLAHQQIIKLNQHTAINRATELS